MTNPTSAGLKNVVVVGAASGIHAANALAASLPSTHRLVLIEANEVAFWPIGALRATVEPGFENQIIAPLDHLYSGSRHVVLNATRVVSLEPNAVLVDRLSDAHKDLATPPTTSSSSSPSPSSSNDAGHRIEFDKIILALGSDYAFPNRTVAPEREKILESFQAAQREVETAQKFLVIGGGPVGVEFVGEVLERFPAKARSITLVTKGNRLVSKEGQAEGLHSKLLSQLQSKRVNLVFEDEIEFGEVELKTGLLPGGVRTFKTKEKGVEVEADYLLDGTGGRPNTSLVASIDASILNDVGAIKVEPSLRIRTSSSPSFDWSSYFAIGDCNDVACAKTSFAAEGQAKAAAANVLALVSASDPHKARLKDAALPLNIMAVPLGKSGGASQLPFISLGGWFTGFAKGKSLFVSKFQGMYK